MKFHKRLERVRNQFISDINQITDFVKTVEKYLNRKLNRKLPKTLSTTEKEELSQLATFFQKITEAKQSSPQSFTIKSPRIGKLLMDKAIPIKQQNFFAEMSLSYLITFQEAFLKDYLKVILSQRKSILKSNKQISYEEVCSHNSIKSLVSHLAQKEVDTLGFGSIEDFSDYFIKRFKISFEDFSKWNELKEANYRRNILVHNRGIANDIYCLKTSHNKKGERLSTDLKYVLELSNTIKDFIIYIHNSSILKFKS